MLSIRSTFTWALLCGCVNGEPKPGPPRRRAGSPMRTEPRVSNFGTASGVGPTDTGLKALVRVATRAAPCAGKRMKPVPGPKRFCDAAPPSTPCGLSPPRLSTNTSASPAGVRKLPLGVPAGTGGRMNSSR
jgi:hypothetical protein